LRTAHSRRTRIAGGIATAAISALALTSCFGGPASTDVDTIDDVKTATIQIQAQGTFIEPGTIEPVEYGSRGSGFFVTADGIAVTNNHVVTGAGTLKVWVGGDQSVEYGATVLGASECLDLAVIKVDGDEPFPTLGWYEGEIPQALDVYSAGFPLGDPNFTLTKGIVSKADVPQEDSWASLDHVIEHDARIRGGNSGGPLVAENGHVVGVNYAGNDELDYNFAIHRDQVLPVLDDLIAGKLVQSLGLNAQALSPNENGEPLGIWVSSVKAGSAGDKAGIEPGDVLISLAGVTLASTGSLEEYCEVIRTQGIDATMDVEVYRPSEDAFYEGQFAGDELELTQGGGGTDPIDPVDVGSFVFVSDDSGAVQVSVPETWAQVDGAPATDAAGNQFLQVVASPDLAGYSGSWTVPGVAVSASQALVGTDLDAALAEFSAGAQSSCTLDNSGDYDDGLYVGIFAYFTDCGGEDTDFVTLVANDVSNTHFIVVSVQMVSEADRTIVLDEVLGTFIAAF
jgi:serine protease Do